MHMIHCILSPFVSERLIKVNQLGMTVIVLKLFNMISIDHCSIIIYSPRSVQQPKMYRVVFKHSSKPWKDLPSQYIKHMIY